MTHLSPDHQATDERVADVLTEALRRTAPLIDAEKTDLQALQRALDFHFHNRCDCMGERA